MTTTRNQTTVVEVDKEKWMRANAEHKALSRDKKDLTKENIGLPKQNQSLETQLEATEEERKHLKRDLDSLLDKLNGSHQNGKTVKYCTSRPTMLMGSLLPMLRTISTAVLSFLPPEKSSRLPH